MGVRRISHRHSIYLVRLGLTTYYNYRISKVQAYMDDLQKQRDKTIDKLKAATKYNTTQQLLEKYGGSPSPKVKSGSTPNRKPTPGQNLNTPKGGRTGFAPPPTANIPGRNVSNPQRLVFDPRYPRGQSSPLSAGAAIVPPEQQALSPPGESAEFAPNAFSPVPQYAQADSGPRWYDRLLDVLLGEDETLPRNRIALICKRCRLVNGQAPPGVKRLEEVGKWKCNGCGAVNGEISEAETIVATIKEQTEAGKQKQYQESEEKKAAMDEITEDELARSTGERDEESDVTQYSEVSEEKEAIEAEESPEPEPAKPKRGRPKGSTKKKS
ncbi:MAG: hypothetical protein LQ347_000033 [Umbilicaria vellea]|nr:MAG: hypothetical protein LQ347_000033 [Umbilicaria vellea]